MAGKAEVIGSSVGLVPRNADVFTDLAWSPSCWRVSSLGRFVGMSDLCLRIRQYGKYAVEAPGSVLEDRYYMFSDSKLQFIALMG